MQWKKAGVIVLILFSLFLVSCTPASGPSADDIWDKLLWFGTLGFLGNNEDSLVGFMRILIVILVFALLYEGVKVTGISHNSGIAVALVLAIMSGMFIPGAVLAGIGAAYATIISVIFIAAPIVGGLLAFRMIPADKPSYIILRIIVLLLLLMVLISVKSEAMDLLPAATGGMQEVQKIFS